MARPQNRSFFIVEQKYILLSFNFEEFLSSDATYTGNVSKIRKAMDRFGEKSPAFTINVKYS